MDICYALDVTPEQILTGVGIDDANEIPSVSDRIHIDKADMRLLEDYHGMQDSQRKRLLAYVETLKKFREIRRIGMRRIDCYGKSWRDNNIPDGGWINKT